MLAWRHTTPFAGSERRTHATQVVFAEFVLLCVTVSSKGGSQVVLIFNYDGTFTFAEKRLNCKDESPSATTPILVLSLTIFFSTVDSANGAQHTVSQLLTGRI